MRRNILILWLLLPALVLAACQGADSTQTAQPAEPGRPSVLATTGIVADVVSQVGGDLIDLKVLLPAGTDPHNYSPAPQDAVLLSEADLIFANGAGLETFLQTLVENTGAAGRLVEVSDGIQLLTAAEEAGHAGEEDHTGDPHTWVDPNNVL
ncbi:MAG: metal ABC transporter substrate-binding protein, partial [Anaerolineaceae bacterium]